MIIWPQQHRSLLAVVIFLTLALGAVGYFFIYPKWEEYVETRDEKASLESKLMKSEWPRDPGRLTGFLNEYNKRLDKNDGDGKGLREKTREILEKSTSMFNDKIISEYCTISFDNPEGMSEKERVEKERARLADAKANFMSKASQTEYKNQYDELNQYFLGKNIILEKDTFGMDETTAEPSKYQMLLKLWTTKAIVDCALASKLRILPFKPTERHGSNITVLPMNSYFLKENDENPYLLEFPVKLELFGTLESFSTFADIIFSENNFLPVTNFELTLAPNPNPNFKKTDQDGNVPPQKTIVVRLTCSSFFVPSAIQVKDAGSSKRVEAGPKPAGI